MAEKNRRWSVYSYGLNNPIRFIDPDGMLSDFYDDDGNLVKHVEDGSTAQYQQTGTGTNLHYEFTGFDKAHSGIPYTATNTVNLTTAIQEQQNLNESNSALDPVTSTNADGTTSTTTYCNFATQNIFQTVASATDNSSGVSITGMATDMVSQMECSTTFIKTDRATATDAATNGGLGIIGEKENGHGHVATFSTGDNVQKGEVANVGATNGFIDLHGDVPSVFGNKKFAKVEYFILNPAVKPKSDEPKPKSNSLVPGTN